MRGPVGCALGCPSCCLGPFDVSPPDAWLVLEGLAMLPDSERRVVFAGISASAREQRALAGRLDVAVGTLGEDAFDDLCDELAEQPCPLFDGQQCRVTDHRPLACRIRGAIWAPGTPDEHDARCHHTGEANAVATSIADVLDALEPHDRGARLPTLGADRTTLAIALDDILSAKSG